MSRHHRIVIELALRILRAAMAGSREGRVDTIEVRLALRCLLHHCPERWQLALFWDAAAQENDIGRAQGCAAAFNALCASSGAPVATRRTMHHRIRCEAARLQATPLHGSPMQGSGRDSDR